MQCQLQPIVWLIFFNKLFHFLYKIWMLQVIKSDSCGISAVFFQCCFMIETQVLMAVSDFSGIFSRKHFLEVGFTFQWQVYFLRWGASFLSWGCPWGASVLMGEFSKKNCRGGHPPCPPLWETLPLNKGCTGGFQLLTMSRFKKQPV